MACPLFGAKRLSKPTLCNCQLELYEQTSEYVVCEVIAIFYGVLQGCVFILSLFWDPEFMLLFVYFIIFSVLIVFCKLVFIQPFFQDSEFILLWNML